MIRNLSAEAKAMHRNTLTAWTAAALFLLGPGALAAPASAGDDAALAALQSAYERSVPAGEDAARYRDLFPSVLQRVRRSSVVADIDLAALAAEATKAIETTPAGSGEPAAVFRKAVHAALQPIDPYFRYFDPRTSGSVRGEATGSFGGLGIEIEASGGALRVVAPMPGSPAERAGVVSGDLIVRVDDQPVSGHALAEAIARMRGQPGTAVSITIQRAGSADERTLSLTRDTIRRQSLRSSMEGDVLVLRLAGFPEAIAASLEHAVAQAAAERAPKAVVLDLRGNPGGMLREAVRVADAFLGAGEIVSLRGSSPLRQRTWQADGSEVLAGVPMVVLIDGRSASAAELVADALQHNQRATVMGRRSFGKGSVQTVMPLGENKGAIRLTTAYYHGPSGQSVHKVGVTPDIELVDASASETARRSPDAAHPPATPTRPLQARVAAARCAAVEAVDPALACAVAYLRAGSVEAFVTSLPEN
jgi:carboxyl-terminal processing protease